MGRSNADNSTKTTTTYSTNQNTTVGLTGGDVSNIVRAFSDFGLQSQQLAYSQAHPDAAQSMNLSSYIPWLIGGAVVILFLLR